MNRTSARLLSSKFHKEIVFADNNMLSILYRDGKVYKTKGIRCEEVTLIECDYIQFKIDDEYHYCKLGKDIKYIEPDYEN